MHQPKPKMATTRQRNSSNATEKMQFPCGQTLFASATRRNTKANKISWVKNLNNKVLFQKITE